VGIDPEDQSFWIGGLIIDQRHQRRDTVERWSLSCSNGLRRTASERRRLSYDPQNTLAQSLYASMGFVETGELVDNETVARRQLK
jgi:diamine N-acetyltransferase